MNYAGGCCNGATTAASLSPAGDAGDVGDEGDESEWWAVGVITGLPPTPTPSRLVLVVVLLSARVLSLFLSSIFSFFLHTPCCHTRRCLTFQLAYTRWHTLTGCSDDGSDDGASLLPHQHGNHLLPLFPSLSAPPTHSLSVTPLTLIIKGC